MQNYFGTIIKKMRITIVSYVEVTAEGEQAKMGDVSTLTVKGEISKAVAQKHINKWLKSNSNFIILKAENQEIERSITLKDFMENSIIVVHNKREKVNESCERGTELFVEETEGE